MADDTRSVSDWREWLEFLLQFKRHSAFVAMERAGDKPWSALQELCALLHSSQEVDLVNKTVERYRSSGGSLRGAIHKGIEALTQRYCPRGTREKLENEMNVLRKHHMSVHSYTVSFHHLLDLYSLLSVHDGETLTTADVCKLYSNGMPLAWQDRVSAETQNDLDNVRELESSFKRLEREEREQEEYQSRKRRRAEGSDYHDDVHRDDRRSSHQPKRHFSESNGCSYCQEFFYGDIYKTHNDEQCYRNPKNKNSTFKLRYVPRGKVVAVFGPGGKKCDDDGEVQERQRNEQAPDESKMVCGPEPRSLEARDTKPTTLGAMGHIASEDSDPSVVKQEPKFRLDEPVPDAAAIKSSASSDPELTKCSVDPRVKCSADINTKCTTEAPVECLTSTATDSLTDTPIKEAAPVPDDKLVKPFEEILLAMVGPFGQTDWCVLVFVDTATQFVELCPVVHATSEEITHAIDQEWLSRYPWPARFTYSARVPAYDPAFSHLKSRCSGYGTLPVAEPASTTSALKVLLLNVHCAIELKVIEMQPQSHTDWASVVSVARLSLRSGNISTADPCPTKASVEPPSMKQDPLSKPSNDSGAVTQSRDSKSTEFAPDDMVFVEYREMRRCIGITPRREGPFRVEAVRTNGTLLIDKGKYLEHIHARRAVLANR